MMRVFHFVDQQGIDSYRDLFPTAGSTLILVTLGGGLTALGWFAFEGRNLRQSAHVYGGVGYVVVGMSSPARNMENNSEQRFYIHTLPSTIQPNYLSRPSSVTSAFSLTPASLPCYVPLGPFTSLSAPLRPSRPLARLLGTSVTAPFCGCCFPLCETKRPRVVLHLLER